ncbi:MAG: hypothetical protein AB1432_04230 [Bacteroidota bacterium]|jgi:nucleoside-diphosphate-sugar epimerase
MTNDQCPVIYGDGSQSRDFIYPPNPASPGEGRLIHQCRTGVANVVEANILAATKEIETPVVMLVS